MCLVRRDGPFVEYRIDAVKDGDLLVSTTTTGLPPAVSLDGAIALTNVSLARCDDQHSALLAAQAQPSAPPGGLGADIRAVATATPTPAPPPATVPPRTTPTARPAVPAAPAPKVKLLAKFDDRLAEPRSELVNSEATTTSGEKMSAFLRRVVEETDLNVIVDNLRPNVRGQLQSVARMDGDKAKISESGITINTDAVNESPGVLAAMLAHEIRHANQPVVQSGGKPVDCVEVEVEAYCVQARVWAAFWGQAQRPVQTKWERSMNAVANASRDGGDAGLRRLVRDETDADVHSCI